jgi:hypothetical protein
MINSASAIRGQESEVFLGNPLHVLGDFVPNMPRLRIEDMGQHLTSIFLGRDTLCDLIVPRGAGLRDPEIWIIALQLRAGGLHRTRWGELLADCLTAFSAGELALALAIEASFISIDG